MRLTSAQPRVSDYAIIDMRNEASFSVSLGFGLKEPLSDTMLGIVAVESLRIRDSVVIRKDIEEATGDGDAFLSD